ncbi:MAG: prepilin-type N-terminal cleavage/methylation domain-containing protein [Anaerolineae bacterium]|nr:prepilin-type N-terminal cleavage/methylation domain-containing protein [Anaerolineae bacterium]MCI0604684.1 prepilin-type N-terminal cleavage/methylation domain-containing protein [bacterium]
MKNDGFTLVEILISMAILAIAIIGIIAAFPQALKQVAQSEHISTINHLGQAKLDELRGLPWNDNDLLDGTHPSTGLGDPAAIETADNYTIIPGSYSRGWRVTDIDSGLRKQVKVTVGYLIYDDAGNLMSAPTKMYGPQAIHMRTADFTMILTRP